MSFIVCLLFVCCRYIVVAVVVVVVAMFFVLSWPEASVHRESWMSSAEKLSALSMVLSDLEYNILHYKSYNQ